MYVATIKHDDDIVADTNKPCYRIVKDAACVK